MATAEQIALARKIAAKVVKNRGLKRDNGFEYSIALEAALAAIIETTELAISCGDTLYESPVGTWQAMAVERYQNALRNFDHLKEHPNGE